jgi:hypothetical protein
MGHIHQTQCTQGNIKGSIREQECLGIHARPGDVTQSLVGSHLLGVRHHLAGDIDTYDCPTLADLPGDAARDEARATRHIERPFAWPYICHLEQAALGRR